jgi:succinyl-diaminopimelate desuccinylase
MVGIQAGIGAANVSPPTLHAEFNFRYSNEWSYQSLQDKVVSILGAFELDYELDWILSGEPFLTQPGRLIDAVTTAISEKTGSPPELSTGGGTSDGRFIAPSGAQVVELGLINATVHKANECVKLDDVSKLGDIYRRIMELLLLE